MKTDEVFMTYEALEKLSAIKSEIPIKSSVFKNLYTEESGLR